jgi:protein-L-isoaspartate(D-aspartate) O-methyltransferase
MGAWESVRWRERAAALAEDLTARRILTDRVWRTGLQEVPRHVFVPARAWAESQEWTGTSRVIDRKAAASDWWNAVYTDCSIITQRDDGDTDPADPAGTPTCSLSCPSIAMEYLHLLDVNDHHRVLEIGTGTGWTAAMLAWRVAQGGVLSVEVDEVLADTALSNLRAFDPAPAVVVADGAGGCPDGAPFDRVHVTCGVRDIPPAWIEQTRPGGRIVLPWMPVGGDAYGHQLVLDVVGDGAAIGRIAGGGGFMLLRSQRRQPAPADGARVGGPVVESTTQMDPRLVGDASGGLQLVLWAMLPGVSVTSGWERTADGWAYIARLGDGESVASCAAVRGADDYQVLQSGQLWAEAEHAVLWWLRQGSPAAERFGVMVEGGKLRLWLDRPDNLLT